MDYFLNQIGVIRYTGLDKLRKCVRDVLEMVNFTSYRTWLFLTGTFLGTTFQFLECQKQICKIRRAHT